MIKMIYYNRKIRSYTFIWHRLTDNIAPPLILIIKLNFYQNVSIKVSNWGNSDITAQLAEDAITLHIVDKV